MNYPGTQNPQLTGGLAGMMMGLQRPQVDAANQLQNELARAQMEQAIAQTENYRALAANQPTGQERFAEKIAKAKDLETRQKGREEVDILTGLSQIAGKQNIAPIIDNLIAAKKLSPRTLSILNPAPNIPNYTVDALNAARESLIATDPEYNKVLTTGMKTASQEKIATGKNTARAEAFKMLGQNRIDVQKLKNGIAGILRTNPANIAIHKAAQITAVNNTTTRALMKANELGDEEERAALIKEILAEAEKKKQEINSIYGALSSQGGAPATPAPAPAPSKPSLPKGWTIK